MDYCLVHGLAILEGRISSRQRQGLERRIAFYAQNVDYCLVHGLAVFEGRISLSPCQLRGLGFGSRSRTSKTAKLSKSSSLMLPVCGASGATAFGSMGVRRTKSRRRRCRRCSAGCAAGWLPGLKSLRRPPLGGGPKVVGWVTKADERLPKIENAEF